MALGSLLLQPQALDRLQNIDEDQVLGDDILALLSQILLNPAHAQSIMPAFRRAFDAMTERLRTRLEPRMERALDELRNIIKPVLDQAQAIADKGKDMNSAADALELASMVAEQLIELAESLSEPQLRDFAGRIHSLLSDTLGLNQTVLKDELRQVFRDVRSELLNGVNAMESGKANIHLALATLFGRLEQELFDQWQSLDLNPNRLAQLLMQALEQSGFEEIRSKLSCLLEKLQAVLRTGGNIIELAQPSPFGSGSVGSAQARPPLSGDTYCWYASWLYATLHRDIDNAGDFFYWLLGALPLGFPTDEVWLSEDRTQLILRKAFRDDEILHEQAGGNLEWYQAPQFTTASGPECFTFGLLKPKAIEIWTIVFDILRDFSKGSWHIYSCATSPKDYAVNIPLIVWNFSKVFVSGIGQAPLPSLLNNRAGWNVGSEWMYILVPWLTVLLGAMEGKHTETNSRNKFVHYVSLLMGDIMNAVKIDALPSKIHEGLLSIWTLLNNEGPGVKPDGADTRPLNRQYGGPFVSLVNFGATYLLMYLLSRDDYTYPCHKKNKKFHLNWWLYSTLMGAASGLTGSLLAWAMSRTVDWKEFGKEIGNGAFQSWFLFMITQYSFKEGDTDDGKYNPTRNADGVAYTPARQPFAGYPPHTTSPYKLPYVKDKSLYVVQGNQGMFSHTRFNPTATLYSYDIAHDFGDEVLAARAGTVVDFYDWIDDDIDPNNSQRDSAFTQSETDMSAGWRGTNKPKWNFIIIRHDSQNAEHDKGPNGTAVTTYGIYGHGKQGSVRAAFLAHADSKSPGQILGTTVQQGQPIMQAGDTGNSVMNHLHMQVMSGPATAPAGSITRLDQLSDYTLPFVFREQKGALQSLTWYKSDNERVN